MRVSTVQHSNKNRHKKLGLLVFLVMAVASVLANTTSYVSQPIIKKSLVNANLNLTTNNTRPLRSSSIPVINREHDWHRLSLDRNVDTLSRHYLNSEEREAPSPIDTETTTALAIVNNTPLLKPSTTKDMMMASLSSNPSSYITGAGNGSGGGGGTGGRSGQAKSNQTNTTEEISPPTASTVPLPGAIWLLGSAMLGFIGYRRNR